MSSTTEENKKNEPEKPTESPGIISSITDSLGITDSKKDEGSKEESKGEEVPIVNVVKPDEPSTSVETETTPTTEEPTVEPTVEPTAEPTVEPVVAPKIEKTGKKKKHTKKMLFKNKRIQNLLKKMKTSKKTEDQLLIELDDIINKKIDIEIKKHNEMIKSLREQKSMLINKIKKEYTKKSANYPEIGMSHKKSRKAKKAKPMENIPAVMPEPSQQLM